MEYVHVHVFEHTHCFLSKEKDLQQAEKYADSAISLDRYNPHGKIYTSLHDSLQEKLDQEQATYTTAGLLTCIPQQVSLL